MIKAVTFDLWDTLIDDDSDEPKRAARGLRSKKAERRHLVWEALNRQAPIDRAQVDLAYDVADAAFNHVWRVQHVNWLIEERLDVLLKGLGRELPDDAMAALVEAHARMEVEVPPDAVEGAAACLEDLSRDFKLCVVSDAIVTPGRLLRELLEIHELRDYFSGFAFSDEVGHAKPHRSMFEAAAAQLGVELHEMVHVGDRDHNDVKGPQALGLKAVLFTATRDADRHMTSADAICANHHELPGVIRDLAGRVAA